MNSALSHQTTRLEAAGPSIRRLKFGGDSRFHVELKRRVEAHFREIGHSKRDCPAMYAKTAIILLSFATSYGLLVFFATAWWQVLPLAIALALSVVGIGFNVMHDASHQAYSDRPWLNRLMAMSLDLIGGSSYFWHWKHGVFHHSFVNVIGYDTDIDLAGLGRLTPHHPRAWIHRWQHWYVWFLYGAMVVKWHLYDDFRLALTCRMGEHSFPRPRPRQWAVFFGGKLVFLLLAFGVPLALHPAWAVVAVYLTTTVIVGVVLGVVFQLAHCVEQADFPLDHVAGPHRQGLGGASGRKQRRLRARQPRRVLAARRLEFSDRAPSVLAHLSRQLSRHRRRRRTDLPGLRRRIQQQRDLPCGRALALPLVARDGPRRFGRARRRDLMA